MDALMFSEEELLNISTMPELSPDAFANELTGLVRRGWRILAYFGRPVAEGEAALFAILGHEGRLCALRSRKIGEFSSVAGECPQAQLFEREIYEELGIMPHDHPWLKPVRVTPDAHSKSRNADYGFYRVQGGHAHEVAVGPIHAGIIEPGHFRFNCYGEIVLNLEIALGYQQRGIEKKLLSMPLAASGLRLRLVECIAGDSSVAYAIACCLMVEKLLQYGPVSPYARRMRRIGLELERLACHCGDLGAIAGDTGFLPTSSWNGRIRGDFLNLTAALCGNRFGREFLKPGGVVPEFAPEQCTRLMDRLGMAGEDAIGSSKAMFASASVRDRMKGTGVLSRVQGVELGLVGVAGRACGIACDVRYSSPDTQLPLPAGVKERLESSGDVYARARVRFEEMCDSLAIVKDDLQWLAQNGGKAVCARPGLTSPPPDTLAVSLAEGWRGAICHVIVTDEAGAPAVCKFVDPSFHNWPGLALAMRDGQISDFPLCNKSFNLSYCGHDQ